MNPSLPESQTIPCDIVLLPSEEQSRLAVEASQLLSRQGALITLDNQDFYAHASLYMFQMDVNTQNACIAALQQIAERNSAQRLEQDGYFYQDSGSSKGYVDVAYSRNSEADSLQTHIISVFNNLRAGMRESDKQKMTGATGLKLENLQKYGCPAIGEFTRIDLFEMGSNDTCIRKIADFNLTA
jgi:hypothetical protein